MLVIGRLLKSTANGRREKVAEELRVFARLGFQIDVATFDDADAVARERYREELKGIVTDWFVWRDPLLWLLRTTRRLLALLRGRRADEAGLARPQRPALAPGNPLNLLLSLPDPNVGWALLHRRRLARLVRARGYSHIYTLSSPHSVHLAGHYLKRRFPHLDWTLSFRDPWSNYPLQHPGRFARWLNLRWEWQCLALCDRAVIYKGWTPGGHAYYAATFGTAIARKVLEAPYIGCDEAAIDRILFEQPAAEPEQHALHFVHLGTLYGNDHTPLPFLEALAPVLAEDSSPLQVTVSFLGMITPDALVWLKRHPAVAARVRVERYLPYAEAIRRVAGADVALWFQAEESHFRENIPAKVFEYAYLGLPMLVISRSGVVIPELVGEERLRVVRADNQGDIRAALRDIMRLKQSGLLPRYGPLTAFSRSDFNAWFRQNIGLSSCGDIQTVAVPPPQGSGTDGCIGKRPGGV